MQNFIQQAVADRRKQLGPAQQADLSSGHWGLALSGGGIRSATFCLGLLQALAKNKVFHRFDLLSTVSGGGYVGCTVGRLFQQAPQAGNAAQQVEQALDDADRRWFAWWLRANGRYLIPHGTKDAFFAAATFARNLLAVHFELALLALLLGLLLSGVDLVAWQWVDGWSASNPDALALVRAATGWPTPWLLLPVLAAFAAVVACVYWVYPSDTEQEIPGWRWFAALVALAGLYALAAAWSRLVSEFLLPRLVLGGVACALVFMVLAALGAGLLRLTGASGARVRNRLTAWLAVTMKAGLAVFLAGCIDYLAWHLSLADGGVQGQVALGIALAGAVLRALLPRAADLPGSVSPLLRRSLGALLNLAGLMVLAGLVIFWVSLVHTFVTQRLFGTASPGGALTLVPTFENAWYAFLALLVPAAVMFITSARNVGFLNKSSLYSFYKARLVRGYLGAANAARFGAGNALDEIPPVRNNESLVHVDRVHEGDDTDMAGYQPHRRGGPVHLVNVCANQTRDPRGGLFNQDRKGISLTVGPGCTRLGLQEWQALQPERALTLGSWMAISGAAVSPGLGAATRPGIAALAMMAGLRLGYWWDSRPRTGVWRTMGKYGLILDELLGRFDLQSRSLWFLSDGGHFENTGAYALLREKCRLVVLADCGADPRYAFADIENLVRKARIDLQADIQFLRPKSSLNHGWQAFGSLSDIASSDSSASLALARIDYGPNAEPGFLVVVKPTTYAGLPVDLVNFKADNPAFPQEPTTDQFFDESQWESYFRLGSALGAVLTRDVLVSAPEVAAQCFEADDGALTQHARGAAPAAGASTEGAAVPVAAKRLPARIVATGAVTASVSVGAIASLGVTAYQTIDREARQRHEAQKTDPAEMKELTKLYTEVVAARGDERPKAAVSLAAALLRVTEQVCAGPSAKGYQASPNIKRVLAEATCSCSETAAHQVKVCRQLVDDNAAACLQPPRSSHCVPHYWIRDYTEGAGNCRPGTPAAAPVAADEACPTAAVAAAPAPAPAPAPVPAPAPAPAPGRSPAGAPAQAPAPAAPASAAAGPASSAASGPAQSKVCANMTVYLQIYGPEQRESARSLRTAWRALGASVPPIEDVVQSARQDQRAPPSPVPEPTLVTQVADPSVTTCAEALKVAASTVPGYPSWTIRGLPSVLQSKANPRVIEAWLPPQPASAAAAR